MQLDIFPDQMVLRRKDPTQNMNRFYRLVIQQVVAWFADFGEEASPDMLKVAFNAA